MPLSEHEQRILAELEESLSKHDPQFAKNVRETNVYSHALRRVRWGIVGFLIGLAVLIGFFSQNVVVGILGVVVMFGSAVLVERNARRIGRASWRDITRPAGTDEASSASPTVAGLREWIMRLKRRA
jgi:hypothetical protein